MSEYPSMWDDIARRRKEEENWRCERCCHPDRPSWYEAQNSMGANGSDYVSRGRQHCDRKCSHEGARVGKQPCKKRVLTVHHLDGDKSNCADWNLAVLCQVCHLHIQAKVNMEQPYMFEHSDWFKWHVEGYKEAKR